MATSPKSQPTQQLPMFSSAAPPVRRSLLPVFEAGLPTLAEVLRWPSSRWLAFYAQDGSSGKMFPVSSLPTADAPSGPSFQGWGSSGMGGPTEFSTLSISDWPSDASVCSLSRILEETGDVHPRFYLSPKACAGILRRAAKRGKVLPARLEQALRTIAETEPTP